MSSDAAEIGHCRISPPIIGAATKRAISPLSSPARTAYNALEAEEATVGDADKQAGADTGGHDAHQLP